MFFNNIDTKLETYGQFEFVIVYVFALSDY